MFSRKYVGRFTFQKPSLLATTMDSFQYHLEREAQNISGQQIPFRCANSPTLLAARKMRQPCAGSDRDRTLLIHVHTCVSTYPRCLSMDVGTL